MTAQLDVNRENVELNQYKIAMVSEMIHAASLIHDDVIDESELRRGKPSANARWGNRQVWVNNGEMGGVGVMEKWTPL